MKGWAWQLVLRHPSCRGVWWGHRDPSVIAALPNGIKGLMERGIAAAYAPEWPLRPPLREPSDEETWGSVLAACFPLECCLSWPSLWLEGAGKAGRRRHPQHRVQWVERKRTRI